MTILKTAAAIAALGAALTVSAPAAAVITTFANYSGVGGANMYWKRSGTNYTVATTASVKASHVVPLPVLVLVTGTTAQKAAKTAANTLATNNYNAAVAAQIPIQTAASAASASATAGGQLYTIATPLSTTPGSVATKFTFLSPTPTNALHVLAALGPLDASFTFLGTAVPGTTVVSAGGFDIQSIQSGTFSFTYTGLTPLVVGHSTYLTGANLLSATFTDGAIAGFNGSTSGAAGASTGAGAVITYSSDFLNFISTNAKDYSISASSITPPLGFALHQALNTFKGTTTGSFSTDPQPVPSAIIPEPAVWGMLVVGFGLVGVQTRRRKRSTIVVA